LIFVSEDWYFWSHRLPLARGARDGGYHVMVATRVGNYGEAIRSEGFELIPISMTRRSRGVWAEFKALAELIALYRRLKPDLVHHVAVKPVLYGSIGARAARIPNVVNAFAGLGWLFGGGGAGARLRRRLVSRAFRVLLRRGRVIVQNPDDRDVLIGTGLKAENVTVIRGSGVELNRFAARPEPKGVPVVLLASRMIWEKGISEFVEAGRLLHSRGVRARFVLVGEPDPENPSTIPEDRLRTWQQEGSVEWWGRRYDMPEVFEQATVICLPSFYREGVPKVLIEAAASGRPIVTTETPGCREIVRHQYNGLLVSPRNPAALADAVGRLLEEPDLRKRMGRAGRTLVETEFSVESVVGDTLALYRDMLTT